MLPLANIKAPSNRTLKIFADAIAIQTRLYDLGFKSVIAGGFARDLFFGLEPKDCDIIIFGDNADEFEQVLNLGRWENTGEVDEVFGGFCKTNVAAPLRLTDELFMGGNWCAMYGDKSSEEATLDRVLGVYQMPHINVDLIVYEDCDTALEVIDAFDFNVNQFAIAQNLEDKKYFPNYFGTTDLRELILVRNDASGYRQLKVFNKHQTLLPLIEDAYKIGRL